MSKKNNIVYLDRKKELTESITNISKGNFPDYVEKLIDNDLDRHLLNLSHIFKNQMVDIHNTYYLSLGLLSRNREECLEKINKIISDNKLREVKHDNSIEYFFPKNWSKTKLHDVNEKWQSYEAILDESSTALQVSSDALYVSLFSKFEVVLVSLFGTYLIDEPDSEQYGVEWSLEKIKDKFTTISEVKDFLHNKKMDKVKLKSYPDRFKWMKEHPKFILDELERKIFDELYGIRNDIVHNNSLNRTEQINNLFNILQKHPLYSNFDIMDVYNTSNLEGKEDSFFIERTHEINNTLFGVCFDFLCTICFKMILSFWTKLNKKHESDHVYIFNTHIYSLFNVDKLPGISASLFENLISSNIEKKQSDEVDSLLLYSQSLKECEDDSYLAILDKIDWSALSENYMLIKYGLLDDIKSVIKFINNSTKNDSIMFFREECLVKAILLGSFFWDMKKDKTFSDAYEETFEEVCI